MRLYVNMLNRLDQLYFDNKIDDDEYEEARADIFDAMDDLKVNQRDYIAVCDDMQHIAINVTMIFVAVVIVLLMLIIGG